MHRRMWEAIMGHVGGLGVFSFLIFGGFAVWMSVRLGHHAYSAGMMVFWYIQARLSHEKNKRRTEAIEAIDDLVDEGVLTPENAARLRRAIRDE